MEGEGGLSFRDAVCVVCRAECSPDFWSGAQVGWELRSSPEGVGNVRSWLRFGVVPVFRRCDTSECDDSIVYDRY